jgi:hypothetical protein
MTIYSFGSGKLIGRRNDVANGPAVPFGLLQEVSLDFTYTVKELYGQFQFPVAIARGTGKTTGKAKVASLSGVAYNALFFGMALSAGQLAFAYGEAGVVPAVSTFIITVANAAAFSADMGVSYVANGIPLTKVASAPTAIGQYSVNETTGVYTFNASDANAAVLISYTYNVTGTGEKIVITNQLLGTNPTFQIAFGTTFQGKSASLILNSCMSNKLSMGTKLEDFVTPEFDFNAFADANNVIGTMSFSEAS